MILIKIQSNPVNTETEGAIQGAHVNRVSVLIEFRENVRAFFTQGQSKLCAPLLRCLYYAVSVKRGLTVL